MLTTQELKNFDIIVINSSAGKDSQAMLDEMFWQCLRAGVVDRMVVVHSDLQDMEWVGTSLLAEQQAQCYGLPFLKTGREESLLDYVARRGMWPSSQARFCTSDFKRDPIQKILTQLTNEFRAKHGNRRVRILNCLGLRAQESAARAKKVAIQVNKRATNTKREVIDFLPIHDWTEDQVWARIEESGVPHHPAYDLGMGRLSCIFCVFAPKSALMVAGQHNPELLDRFVAVEAQIGHTFRKDFSIREVKEALAALETGAVVSINKSEKWAA